MDTRFDEVVALVGSYATDQGESVGQELGPEAAAAASRVFEAVVKRLKASSEDAALIGGVRGKRRQQQLGAAVIAHLESDRGFRKEIDRLMVEFDDATFSGMGMATGGIVEMGVDYDQSDDSDVVRGPMVGGTIVGGSIGQIGGSGQVVGYAAPPGPITIPPNPRPRQG